MASDRKRAARRIFMEVAALPPEQRESTLTEACGGDGALRAEVEALLLVDEASGFVDSPIAVEAADRTADEGVFLEPGADAHQPTLISPSHESVGQQIDRYKLLEQIGEGGFGTVWAAEQRKPVKRRVALKIIKLGMDTKKVIARFEAERQALAMMDHPNIARVLDAGTTDTGRPFFVMELVRGVPIVEYCDKEKLDTKARLELFVGVCHAIQHAHQKSIIHRDIKPSNVLVTLHDGVPVPKVIDFGIAKATNQELTEKTIYTQHRQMIGTPAYMSPEQAEMSGLDIDTRSDIYSLGVLLYELLTGTTPFTEDELASAGFEGMMRMIRHIEPHKPSTRLSSLGDAATQTAQQRRVDVQRLGLMLRGDLDWIVMKCLEKDRTRRYETANGLAADIQRHLADEPVVAGPPSARYRLRKFVKRNRPQVIGAALVLAVLVLGVAGTTTGLIRAVRAERDQTRLRIAADEARVAEVEQRREAEAARAKEASLREQAQVEAYAADMKAAQAALQNNNRFQANELLSHHRPEPGDRDLRGVEWHYLWESARGDEIQSWEQGGRAPGALFSPDGTIVAAACSNGYLRIWDVASGTVIARFERGIAGDNAQVTFAFAPDGSVLATATSDGVALLDCKSWNVMRRLTLDGSGAPTIVIESLVYSPDSRWLAVSDRTHGVVVWDTRSWGQSVLGGWEFLCFSPDSSALAMWRDDRAEILDMATGTRRIVIDTERLGNGSAPIGVVRFLPRSDRIVTSSQRGHVAVREMSGEIIWSEKAHAGLIYALAVSHDGAYFASGGHDQVIHVWDAHTMEKVATLHGHRNEIWSLDFSPDGRLLVTSSKDGTVKLWNLEASRVSNDWLLEPGERPLGVTADGEGVFTIAEGGGAIHTWRGPYRTASIPFDTALDMSRTLFAAEQGNLYVLDPDGRGQVYDVHTMERERSFSLESPCMRAFHVSPDERWLAGTGESLRDLRLWDLSTGRSVLHVPGCHPVDSFDRGVFSPDGRIFAMAVNEEVRIWDLAEQKLVRTFEPHPWYVYALSFSPDGKLLVSSSWEGDVRIRDVETGADVVGPLMGHASGVHAHGFSPDGATLVTSGDDFSVRFWNVATGREMLLVPQARSRGLRTPLLSPSGRLLFYVDESSDDQRRVRIERIRLHE